MLILRCSTAFRVLQNFRRNRQENISETVEGSRVHSACSKNRHYRFSQKDHDVFGRNSRHGGLVNGRNTSLEPQKDGV